MDQTLRELRIARGLSAEMAARRAGVSKATVIGWEGGRRVPSGPLLVRLLDALEADDRTRARLLHAADPAFARVELAHSGLGAPVDVGMVLRAMRRRCGLTQAELARQVGVAQGTVAKWENGGATPSAESVHALGFTLGATIDETLALAAARDAGAGGVPEDLDVALRVAGDHGWGMECPCVLYEVVSLGWEAELWRRASRDPRWDRVLCRLLGYRANRWVADGRMDEVESVARRALRLATVPEAAPDAVPAVGSLIFLARHRGESPERGAALAASWADRLPDSEMRGWMLKSQGIGLVDMGRKEEGEALLLRAADLELAALARTGFWDADGMVVIRDAILCEVHLFVGRPERAADLAGSALRPGFDARVFVRVAHANGRAVSGAEMGRLRDYCARGTVDGPAARALLARAEHEQARLTGEARDEVK